MKNLNLVISNIHVNNDFLLNDILGIAGFSGCLKHLDDCTATLSQETDLCTEAEVLAMLGSLVLNGFSVKLI